jgi:hypothetical protein
MSLDDTARERLLIWGFHLSEQELEIVAAMRRTLVSKLNDEQALFRIAHSVRSLGGRFSLDRGTSTQRSR